MIKYLVSTEKTQGQRDNDFCFVPENEIVKFSFECSRESVDGECGCKRSMVGIKCLTATTTMKIAELDLTEKELISMIKSSEVESWGDIFKAEDIEGIKKEIKEIIRIAELYPIGSIIEKRGDKFVMRKEV